MYNPPPPPPRFPTKGGRHRYNQKTDSWDKIPITRKKSEYTPGYTTPFSLWKLLRSALKWLRGLFLLIIISSCYGTYKIPKVNEIEFKKLSSVSKKLC